MSAKVPFSQSPGRHERHFRRKVENPLFPRPIMEVTNEDLLEVQRLDHEELLKFVTSLRDLVQRAVDLKPNVESQVILDLKADLDKIYEQACTAADDQSGNKDAIRQLLAIVMVTVRSAAAGDPMAEQQLEEEEQARTTHFRLLEYPVIADLLDPDSRIEEDELIAVLLSEEEKDLNAALELFDDEQLAALVGEGNSLLSTMDSPPISAVERLAQIEAVLQR